MGNNNTTLNSTPVTIAPNRNSDDSYPLRNFGDLWDFHTVPCIAAVAFRQLSSLHIEANNLSDRGAALLATLCCGAAQLERIDLSRDNVSADNGIDVPPLPTSFLDEDIIGSAVKTSQTEVRGNYNHLNLSSSKNSVRLATVDLNSPCLVSKNSVTTW